MVSADSKGMNKAVISVQKLAHVWAAFVTHMFSLFSFSHPKLLNAILEAQQIGFQHLVNRICKAETKFCHLQGAILFIYTVCIYFSQIWLQWTGHGSRGTIAVLGSGTVILAIYTFIVGPWLPTSSAISEGLIHKPVRN